MNNLLKALSQHATQSGMMTKLGLLKSGKLTHRWVIERASRCDLLEKSTRVPIRFIHEKTQHDGTAQSIVNEGTPRDGAGQPDVIPRRRARPQQFTIGNDKTESELSEESRSFLNRMNDQVRKRQKRSSMNVKENEDKQSVIWGMFMSVTLESAVFMGKNHLDNCHSTTNTRDFTVKTNVRHICQYCTDDSGIIIYFRALQGHSGHNLIDPSLLENVVCPSNFFQHIYHVGCAFNLHSIINNGLIPGGQNSSKRQTVFFLPVDPRDKDHKDPEKIDLNVPRHAQYLHNTCTIPA